MTQQNPTPSLILASASPRRRELLETARVLFSIIPSNASEEPLPDEAPAAYALRVAREKAKAIAQQNPDHWILGADTIVVVNNEILGKPKDPADARRMLRLLSGQTHQVMTAFALIDEEGREYASQVVTSTVTFKPLTDSRIESYLATREPFDKAGAYAIQGQGAVLVERVEGSYTNIVGLPIDEVLVVLRAAGIYQEIEASEL
ncbi:MAG: nucleoside triphosphate pyrophosphatase [Candidatus Binatia bacterium]